MNKKVVFCFFNAKLYCGTIVSMAEVKTSTLRVTAQIYSVRTIHTWRVSYPGSADDFRRREHSLLLEALHPNLLVGDNEALRQLWILRRHAGRAVIGPTLERLEK